MFEREGFNINDYTDTSYINITEFRLTNEDETIIGKKFETIENLDKEYALNLLKYILSNKYEKLVDKYDIIYHFNQNQYNALISFAYNVGNIDELTNYGTRTIEEISSSFLDYIYDKEGNPVLLNRRNKEKELFDKPIERVISSQLRINHYEPCSGSYIFSSILTSEDYSENNNNNNFYISPQDIGVIYYDPQNGNTMKTECNSYEIGSITCEPYYPIEEGEYIIKLNNNGYFDNGIMVLPFDLSNDMHPQEKQFNQYTQNFEEVDKRIKIYNLKNPLPIFREYSSIAGLYGNFFFYRGRISLYNKTENIKDIYSVEVELSFCYLNNSCANENKYQIECNIIKLSEEIYDNYNNYEKGEYLLKCKGIINTNVYNIENFGHHIEIRYKIGESSIQDIEKGFWLGYNFKDKSPRDILEITSFNYEYNSNEGNIFYFFGNSLNNKEIRNIGSSSKLLNFNIYFSGGFYTQTVWSRCFLYNDLENFVIKCYLNYIDKDNIILSHARMQDIFINEENNEYDIILPFEFTFKKEMKKWGINYYDENYCSYSRNYVK